MLDLLWPADDTSTLCGWRIGSAAAVRAKGALYDQPEQFPRRGLLRQKHVRHDMCACACHYSPVFASQKLDLPSASTSCIARALQNLRSPTGPAAISV